MMASGPEGDVVGNKLSAFRDKLLEQKEESNKFEWQAEEYRVQSDEEKRKREELEYEAVALRQRIRFLEDEVERVQRNVEMVEAEVCQTRQPSESVKLYIDALETKLDLKCEKRAQLEFDVSQWKITSEEASSMLEEESRKLRAKEGLLERAEKRADINDKKVKELEEELRSRSECLKVLTIALAKKTLGSDAAISNDEYKDRVKSVSIKLEEAELRVEGAQRSMNELQRKADQLGDEVFAEKLKNQTLSKDLDSLMEEF